MLTLWKMNIILYLYVRLLLSYERNILRLITIEIPVLLSFVKLLKTGKKNILHRLSKYLYEAFLLRKSLLLYFTTVFVLFIYNVVNKTAIM